MIVVQHMGNVLNIICMHVLGDVQIEYIVMLSVVY